MRTFNFFVSCILVLQFVGIKAQPHFTTCQDNHNPLLHETKMLRWQYDLTGQTLFNIVWRYKGSEQVASFLPTFTPSFNPGPNFAGRVTLASSNTDTEAAIEITNLGPDDSSEYYVEVKYGSGTVITYDDCTANLTVANGTETDYLKPSVTGQSIQKHVTEGEPIGEIVITFLAEPIGFTLEATYINTYRGDCSYPTLGCTVNIMEPASQDVTSITITYQYGYNGFPPFLIDVSVIPDTACPNAELKCRGSRLLPDWVWIIMSLAILADAVSPL